MHFAKQAVCCVTVFCHVLMPFGALAHTNDEKAAFDSWHMAEHAKNTDPELVMAEAKLAQQRLTAIGDTFNDPDLQAARNNLEKECRLSEDVESIVDSLSEMTETEAYKYKESCDQARKTLNELAAAKKAEFNASRSSCAANITTLGDIDAVINRIDSAPGCSSNEIRSEFQLIVDDYAIVSRHRDLLERDASEFVRAINQGNEEPNALIVAKMPSACFVDAPAPPCLAAARLQADDSSESDEYLAAAGTILFAIGYGLLGTPLAPLGVLLMIIGAIMIGSSSGGDEGSSGSSGSGRGDAGGNEESGNTIGANPSNVKNAENGNDGIVSYDGASTSYVVKTPSGEELFRIPLLDAKYALEGDVKDLLGNPPPWQNVVVFGFTNNSVLFILDTRHYQVSLRDGEAIVGFTAARP